MHLWVLESNRAARAFHAGHGFEAHGAVQEHFRGPEIRLRRRLAG